MPGFHRSFDEQQIEQRDEKPIVVDVMPQYQLSPPHSPQPGNLPKTPEKGELFALSLLVIPHYCFR
jgi:hypothetical protein